MPCPAHNKALHFIIAVGGGIATFVVAYFQSESTTEIKKAQIESAERISAAERDSAEKRFRAEQQVKILEIFGEKFFSDDAKEKELAVKMLAAVDSGLASSLAGIIAKDTKESEQVRTAARVISQRITKGITFPVVGSFKELSEAIAYAKKLEDREFSYQPEIYLSENNYYGVTLGGYLSLEEAIKRTEYARTEGIARDAYPYRSTNWGDNLFK